MSNVGDALSGGGSSASGVNDQTFADASLGDQMQGGTGDFTGGDAGGGPTEFNQFSDVANALSSGTPAGASPTVAQSAAMNPPSAAASTGGDPVGAASGTQSSTTPGSSPADQNQQQQTGQTKNQQDQNQYAPKSATDQLKALLKQLSGKPTGPTGPTVPAAPAAPFALPTLAPGQTGPQSPQMPLPSVSAGETGDQSPGSFQGTPVQPSPPSPVSQVAGAPSAGASIPPGAASAPTASPEGRQITVQPKAGERGQTQAAPQGMPAPQNEPGEVAPGGPALPTRKPTQPPEAEQPATAASPAAAPPTGAGATPRILQDISGASTGSPTALADLAQAARIIAPMLPMLAGLFGGGGRGRRGGFHGGRFTHGVGGFRGGGFHPGGRFGHPAWRGAWPYHHPMHGWDMHHQHPGGGWLPLNPAELQGLGGGQGGPGGNQGGPQASNPTQTTEAGPGQPDDTFQKSGFSANPFVDALVRQESGGGQNIVSKTDKDSQGRTLAQGGNPNEISQGYFQIQNHPGGTWTTYGRQAGIDLNKYPTPRSAPLAVQWQVAQRIPIGQWGPQTKAILRQKFGQFDPNMPFGQVASRFGPAGGRLAAATPSRTQPAWASGPASASLQLPVTSQPSVSASN
jgi:hypothetical protein